jgi:AcrR family transcriptional regulator
MPEQTAPAGRGPRPLRGSGSGSPARTGSSRAPRADALRNRDHILQVAERAFAEHGVTGSLDAIAKQASVGAGTLHRHFPTREALLAELLAARDEHLVTRREALRGGSVDAASAEGSRRTTWRIREHRCRRSGCGNCCPCRTGRMRRTGASESSPLRTTACSGLAHRGCTRGRPPA